MPARGDARLHLRAAIPSSPIRRSAPTAGYAAGPVLRSPSGRDFLHACRLHTNSGIISGATPLSSASPSSVRSDRPRQESLSATIMLSDDDASLSLLRAICLHTPRRSRMPRSKPPIHGCHKTSPLSVSGKARPVRGSRPGA